MNIEADPFGCTESELDGVLIQSGHWWPEAAITPSPSLLSKLLLDGGAGEAEAFAEIYSVRN